jgi:hypothetical protein
MANRRSSDRATTQQPDIPNAGKRWATALGSPHRSALGSLFEGPHHVRLTINCRTRVNGTRQITTGELKHDGAIFPR